MKVILLRDVARIGKRGEVKEVPTGHALNFLIPRKLALPATPENLKRTEQERAHNTEKAAHHDADFKAALATLSAAPVELKAQANAQGHLFKGIRAADIAVRFQELSIPIDVSEIVLEQPIKEVGEHTVTLSSKNERGTCTVRIIPL